MIRVSIFFQKNIKILKKLEKRLKIKEYNLLA
nr:MAG TPA: hypothetical protein [Caudoviricetes sp.]